MRQGSCRSRWAYMCGSGKLILRWSLASGSWPHAAPGQSGTIIRYLRQSKRSIRHFQGRTGFVFHRFFFFGFIRENVEFNDAEADDPQKGVIKFQKAVCALIHDQAIISPPERDRDEDRVEPALHEIADTPFQPAIFAGCVHVIRNRGADTQPGGCVDEVGPLPHFPVAPGGKDRHGIAGDLQAPEHIFLDGRAVVLIKGRGLIFK